MQPVQQTEQDSSQTPQVGLPQPQAEATPQDKQGKKKLSWVIVIPVALLVISGLVFLFGFIRSIFFKPVNTITTEVEQEKEAPPLPVHQLIGSSSAPIRLVYAIHWTETFQTDNVYDENGQLQTKGLKAYLEEYVQLHPEVAIQLQVIRYSDYAKQLQLLHDADAAPDIYQIYSPWAASYVKNQVLDVPPDDVIEDVKANYVSTSGVTVDGKIWGFPTEVNTYSLVYNKEIFREAGISRPPLTFDELVDTAVKTTKYDQNGNIIQYGIAFLKGNDWQVVDPFLSWLFTNNGKYLDSNYSSALFASSEGVEVLDGILKLFQEKATDNNGNFFDFTGKKVAMVIAPPWTRGYFKTGFGDEFDSIVGVVPLPYFKKPATLQYSWFMGVMAKSKHKEEAWDFLRWFNTELQEETQTTRYGDLLANTIFAIPSRQIDIDNHQSILTDSFMSVFVEQLPDSVAEPNVLSADLVKKTIMAHIESVWAGQDTSQQGLQSAADEVDAILSGNR